MKRIAVMLPSPYRGGSLRAAKNIAKSLTLGAEKENISIQVCFSYVKEGNYDILRDFSDLTDLGIEVRETEWKIIPREKLSSVIAAEHLPEETLTFPNYLLPSDGASDFFDCDLWIIISDRLVSPIFPVKKYLIVVYDYIQRYVPEIFGNSKVWDIQESSYFLTTRAATGIIVTTPSTRTDLISYCGVSKEKIHLINMDFTPLFEGKENRQGIIEAPYFLWPTNTTQHKNHLRTLRGIEDYFENPDALDCFIIGPNTQYYLSTQRTEKHHNLRDHPYIEQIREFIDFNPFLKAKIHILGEVPDAMYMQMIKNATFLLHSCLYDNGTFCVLDAAFLGCPSLSARYPAMEYMNQHFGLNLRFFNPYNSTDLSRQLEVMQKEAKDIVLPTRKSLEKYTWQANAVSLYTLIASYL